MKAKIYFGFLGNIVKLKDKFKLKAFNERCILKYSKKMNNLKSESRRLEKCF